MLERTRVFSQLGLSLRLNDLKRYLAQFSYRCLSTDLWSLANFMIT